MNLRQVLSSPHFAWIAIVIVAAMMVLWEGVLRPAWGVTSLSIGCELQNDSDSRIRMVVIDPNATQPRSREVSPHKAERIRFPVEGESSTLVAKYRYGLLVLDAQGELVWQRFGSFDDLQAIDRISVTRTGATFDVKAEMRAATGGKP